jgi:hypothetical protein
MRRPITWLLAGALIAVAVVATVDALRGSSSRPQGEPRSHDQVPVGAADPPTSAAVRLPGCSTRQLHLSIEILGGLATVVLRHASGNPCHLRPLPLSVTVRDKSGRKVLLLSGEGVVRKQVMRVRGDFTPGFEQLFGITSTRCTPEVALRGRFLALASGGPYVARRLVSGADIGCVEQA